MHRRAKGDPDGKGFALFSSMNACVRLDVVVVLIVVIVVVFVCHQRANNTAQAKYIGFHLLSVVVVPWKCVTTIVKAPAGQECRGGRSSNFGNLKTLTFG